MINPYAFDNANLDGDKEPVVVPAVPTLINKLSANEANGLKDKVNEIIEVGQNSFTNIAYLELRLKFKGIFAGVPNTLTTLEVGDIVHGFVGEEIWTNAVYNGGDPTLLASYTNIVGDVPEPINTDVFRVKEEKDENIVNQDDTFFTVLMGAKASYRLIGTMAEVHGVEDIVNSTLYAGQDITFMNAQEVPVSLIHNVVLPGVFPFRFQNAEDVVLQPDEFATLKFTKEWDAYELKSTNKQFVEGSDIDTTASHPKGDYNATTNTPTLTDGIGQIGDYYTVTVAGTFGAIALAVNDRFEYNGTVWFKAVNNNQSVAAVPKPFYINFNGAIAFTQSPTNWYSKTFGPASVSWTTGAFATLVGTTPTAFDARVPAITFPHNCKIKAAGIRVNHHNAAGRVINIKGYVFTTINGTITPSSVREVLSLSWNSVVGPFLMTQGTDYTLGTSVSINAGESFQIVVNQSTDLSLLSGNFDINLEFESI